MKHPKRSKRPLTARLRTIGSRPRPKTPANVAGGRTPKNFFLCASLAFFSACAKWFSATEPRPKNFSINVPLAEEYPLLTETLTDLIKIKFPDASVRTLDYLSNEYSAAPFDEWLTHADDNGVWKLYLRIPDPDEREHILAFLRVNDAKITFKHKIPAASVTEGGHPPSPQRGEAFVCRMQVNSKDMYERQLCKQLLTSLCGGDAHPPFKGSRAQFNRAIPSCLLVTTSTPKTTPAVPPPVDSTPSKDVLLSAFPLPLKVKTDYPFFRLSDADEGEIIGLFKD